ncbi:hypothetical protein KSW81_003079 [Nannochloris sp. 'desiccata']|nr:hypothetical protein KSW81_003079 [Chlorella desiccata (nom. nud.)]
MALEPTAIDFRDALRRLCLRCPAAEEEPLLQQALADERSLALLPALQTLLLNPEYTLPTATICRTVIVAIVSSIIDDALSSVGSPSSSTSSPPHHPSAVAASLIKVLMVAPHIEMEAVRYFQNAAGPFSYISQTQSLPSGNVASLELARCTLWGLQNSRNLRDLWKWPDLLPMLSHPDIDVKWCGAHCLGLSLSGVEQAAMLYSGSSNTHASSSPSSTTTRTGKTTTGKKRKQADEPLYHGWPLTPPRNYVEVCGLDLPRKEKHAREKGTSSSLVPSRPSLLVLTPSMQRNLESCALGLCMESPLLLEGPPSSGKSALLAHLAEITHNAHDLVRVHLDDQTDSKTLLGAYVCATKPGEFVWQPGLLTQAVVKGSWVIIEDINLASAEVLAMLLPLVERRMLHIPSRGEELTAAHGFQLIATVTSDPGAMGAGVYGSSAAVKDLLGGLFHSVRMEPATPAEQAEIVGKLFPPVALLVHHAMASVALVQVATRQRNVSSFSSADNKDETEEIEHLDQRIALALSDAGLRPGESNLGRYFSFRDVLKWARRMVAQHLPLIKRSLNRRSGTIASAATDRLEDNTTITNVADIPIALREAAFVEAADCLCSGLSNHEVADKLLVALASLFAVPASTAEHYSQLAKPAIAVQGDQVTIGRAGLPLLNISQNNTSGSRGNSRFAQTGHAMRHMERVAVAAVNAEPVLLVGETGTGKTTLVQEIASQVGAKLVVVNLSQQTDSSDLIGGFRPLQPADPIVGLLPGFIDLVRRTWQRGNNDEFLDRVMKMATKRRWHQLVKAFRTAIKKTGLVETPSAAPQVSVAETSTANGGAKKVKKTVSNLDTKLREEWIAFIAQLDAAENTAIAAEGGFAFGFFEGALLQAVREGWWLLLDEINLAPAEALERISGLLEEDDGSITVAERGDVDAIAKHPNFRIFAAMNPATDAGKRDLPGPLRNRFTEIWVGEPRHRDDLAAIVAGHLLPVAMGAPVHDVVDFYLAVKDAADTTLQDGAGHKPTYNLRTLSRALEYAARASAVYGLQRALYDGFAMSFLTQLDPSSTEIMLKLMLQHLVGQGTSLKALMNASPSAPSETCVLFDHYWVEVGDSPVAETREDDGKGGVFVATPTVMQHLRNLARAVLLRKYPILLQGPTSSGKTSLVGYLAAQTGHHFVRINNHEQTDLQEYLGTYVSDEQGRLVFQEGLLVQAVRKGHWIVLDELNLAPTEVLEALNRLLDDNRELFVPELQEVVKPHPHFMLFATQNPPGLYAGRKTLSRAFRSRFLELHVEDIPDDELHVILEKRCAIAPSYASKLVSVMRELQRRRALSNVFAGRHGFITPRDLFRWAGRGAVGYQQLAEDGYAVLGERLRSDDERSTVNEVLLKILNAKIDMQALYDSVDMPQMSEAEAVSSGVGRLVWTKTFRRMYWLLDRCLRTAEPALLVGETGLGKTSVCQLAAFARDQTLRIINCNQHTETSDFLGGYRPNRSRESALSMLRESIEAFNGVAKKAKAKLVEKPSAQSITELQSTIVEAVVIANAARGRHKQQLLEHAQAMEQHLATYRAPFEWVDGPLIVAMKRGDIILIDELNLAEDSVLERLNSVLEPSRSVTLAEKGGNSTEVVVAHPDFRVIATMNPGGDYGKKELSPALNNRFTTIWVPAMDDEAELRAILEARIGDPELRLLITPLLLQFWAYYKDHVASIARQVLSVRDLLTWIEFVNSTAQLVNPYIAFAHGAHVAFLDGIGLGVGLSEEASITLRSRCMRFLTGQLPNDLQQEVEVALSLKDCVPAIAESGNKWGLSPFYLDRIGEPVSQGAPFDFNAPTTAKNAFRVLRAMQLRKPILLEGSPGVGKTSLIAAVSKALGRGFVRINLSEQTDMMDLLGADLPVEGGGPGEFAWSDGPLLQAIKSGAWVLLDELNLANQTVLEGLNALLDHRAEVFIPELNSKFKCAQGFRIFGAQNPLQEGGGRKGLPKSFLNRFSRVHVELLQRSDLLFIAGVLYPTVPSELLQQMVEFLHILHTDPRETRVFGAVGGPWEFNLRDLLRWCELITSSTAAATMQHADIALHYAQMLFVSRMRTPEDRAHVLSTLGSFLPGNLQIDPRFSLKPQSLQIGWAILPRHKFAKETLFEKHALLGAIAPLVESVAECISLNWMCLLVGPSGSGKTAVLRTLAQLSGRDLLELPLNSGTDTSDLLGGFEQVDMVRKRHHLIALVEEVFTGLMATVLASSVEISEQVGSLAGQWRKLKTASESPSATAAAAESVLSAISTLADCLPGLGQVEVFERLGRAQLLSVAIQAAGNDMDGRAIIEGRWVVLDNANLCNPSVLDRLNPLLEPHGVLYLNECGTGAQGPRVISPHPNFRLFMTFDPKHGEVSRAMRNRGLELFLLPDRLTGLSQEARAGDASEQLQTVAALQGIPGNRLPHIMAAVHSAMRDQAFARHRRPPSLRELVRWVGLMRNLCSRGLGAETSIQKAFESIYIQPCDDINLREEDQNIFYTCAADCPAAARELWFQPGTWPVPLTVAAYAADSAAMSANRDLAHVLHWAGRLALCATANPYGGDVSIPASAFSASSNLSQAALALSIILPGQKMGQLLLGQSAEQEDEIMITDDDDEVSEQEAALAVATFVQALHVFMERGAGESLHQSWAASILSQCADIKKPLLENGVQADTSSSSTQMVMGSNVASHLTDAIQCLGVYFSNPMVSSNMFSDTLAALRTAITTAVALQRASLQASSGTCQANRTLLQLSSWRFENPGSRNKMPVPHPVVDWLWPFLSAAQACEESLLGKQQQDGDGSLYSFQEERWALLYVTQFDSQAANPSAFGLHVEVLVYVWMKLREAVRELVETLPEFSEKERLKQTAAQVDTALGLDAGLPPAPHLWEKGGKPVLPRTLQQVEARNQIFDLCNLVKVTKEGYPTHPLVLAAVAAKLEKDRGEENIIVEDAHEPSMIDGSNTEAAAIALEVASQLTADLKLRRELLEGICLFEVGLQLHSGGALAEDVCRELASAFKREAEKAVDYVMSRHGKLADSFDIASGTETRMKQALVLPPAAMAHMSGREMQRQLLAWIDLSCSKQQLMAQASLQGSILSLLLRSETSRSSSSLSDISQLENIAQAVAASGCRDISEGAPYNVLLWLLDASENEGVATLRVTTKEWKRDLQQALAHEAWFQWHQALWGGAVSIQPEFTYKSPLQAPEWWKSVSGPMHLHISSLTAHALAITASPTVPISDRGLKLLQLQLAGRHLRRLVSDAAGGKDTVADAEVRSAIIIAAATLEAHIQDLPADVLVAAAIERLGQDPHPIALHRDASSILDVLNKAVLESSHRSLREVWPLALYPALQLLLTHPSILARGTSGLAARGQAWALLGLARLSLVVPPPGTDPAASYDLFRQHSLRLLTLQVEPELVVRRQYAALPGGPSERDAISALTERKIAIEKTAAELEGKSPPRPTPPQYLSLQEDVNRFISGIASLPRMVDMVAGVARNKGAAVQEGRAWIENAGAVAARLSAQYPLYRDILQPVQLSIQEVRYGLALGVGASELTARGDASLLEAAVGRLLAYPRLHQQTRSSSSVDVEDSTVQQIIAHATSQAVQERAALKNSQNIEAAGNAAGAMVKIKLLRSALHEAVEDWRRGATSDAQSAATRRLHTIFAAFLGVWEDIKEEEARLAAEEAETFKTKSRTALVPTEEEEAEEDFKKQYPDQFTAFEDLADPDDLMMDDASEEYKLLQQQQQNRQQEQGENSSTSSSSAAAAAAAFSTKEYFLGEILEEVVLIHAEIFKNATTALIQSRSAAFMRSYELGMQLVELSGGCLSSDLDQVTATGHLYAAAARARELMAPGGANSPLKDEEEEADINVPRPEEAVLVQTPLQSLRVRINTLLEEWPDHPVLMQLDAIATRIFSMPVNSPLKALLTGLELLLARAQVWEETAAKHVTIAPELKSIAALATRWRRLELTGWRALLKRTVARSEAGAHVGWFHLYRIMQSMDTSVQEVSVAIEQFIQGSPLGEYKTRLNLLKSFQGQILASLLSLSVLENEDEDFVAAKKQRNTFLAAILSNMHRYYSQFIPAVEKAVAAGLAPSEKDLRDFVKLAKWEDRGYYAMKASTEKAQRHLHKLCRRAADALKAPATGILAIAAKAMGLDDLTAPEYVGNGAVYTSKKQQKQLPVGGAAVVAALADSTATAAALAAAASHPASLLTGSFDLPEVSGKYTIQLPELTVRFEKVVRRSLSAEQTASAAEVSLFTDELASDVAARAVALRSDVSKGAKARKKKALVDFFRALAAAGVSKLRSAVPPRKRGVQAWFSQPVPDLASLSSYAISGSSPQVFAAQAAWSKADAYYYSTMARLQRVLEAAKYPHADLVPAEIAAACRTSEHLFYLTQIGREALGRVSDQYTRLNGLLTLIEFPEWSAELPLQQTSVSNRCQERQNTLSYLITLIEETQELLRATSELEPVIETRQEIAGAASCLGVACDRLRACAGELNALVAKTCVLPSGKLFATNKLKIGLENVDAVLDEVSVELSHQAQHTGQPGWATVLSALQEASSKQTSTPVVSASAGGESTIESSTILQHMADEVEAMIQAELLWAQNALDNDSTKSAVENEEEEEEEAVQQHHLPIAIDSANKRLGIHQLTKLISHANNALGYLASFADSSNIGGDTASTAANVASAAAMLSAAVPMLRMLRAAIWQSAARAIALHRSVAKLSYISTALFAGVLEQGFCMPEGEEGQPQEGDDTKITEGTGLGEGDTTGAKDISHELEDQDQLLGAQQKDQEEKEQPADAQQQEQEGEEEEEQPKGVEMDEDFNGALEDVKPQDIDENDDDGPEDEEENEDRLDQQMGDVGDQAEDVDEKLWNGDDEEEDGGKDKEEAGHDENNAIQVEDASKLDYAQGQDKEEKESSGKEKATTEAPKQDEDEKKKQETEQGGEQEEEEEVGVENEEEEEDLGEYQDRPEDRGFVQPEAPEQELELPDELNLDGQGEEDEEEDDKNGGDGNEDKEEVIREDTGAFPEQPEGGDEGGEDAEDRKEPGEEGAELDNEDNNEDGSADPVSGPTAQAEEAAPEGEEENEDKDGDNDPMLPADDDDGQSPVQEQAEVDADKGAAAAVAAAAGTDRGAADQLNDDMQVENEGDAEAMADGAFEPPQAPATGTTAGAAGGLQDDASAAQMSGRGAERQQEQQKQSAPLSDSNPYRNLGSALERWRAKLAMAADAPEPAINDAADAGLQQQEEQQQQGVGEGQEENDGGEYRFLGQDEAAQAGDTQALAGATQEQAGLQAGDEEQQPGNDAGAIDDGDLENGAAAMEEEEEEEKGSEDMNIDSGDGAPPPPAVTQGQANWGAGAGEKAGLQQNQNGPGDDDKMKEEEEGGAGEGSEEDKQEIGDDQVDDGLVDGLVASKLRATHLEDEEEKFLEELLEPLSGERAEELRAELDRRLRAASEGDSSLMSSEADLAHGRDVWAKCESLTAGLVGELAEQLRLILEPTLASKLGGEYRTGKRINMKRVIGYIASHFRKDKIWMRRTRPDKRTYQVLVAIDDSRSMAETGCSGFAVEALTLICRAMSRLDVGELGVVSFGGSGGAEPLHNLDKPFTEVDGVRVMSKLRFDQDNTIGDRPMVDVITSVDHLLGGAAARAASNPAGGAALNQLVLIIADGRFHEKEALKRAARDAAARPGVLYAFIVLDNAANSILDMQSVAFVGGKPIFTKYMDSFPFPFYIVLRDTAALPRTLADLLRQWFELQQR